MRKNQVKNSTYLKERRKELRKRLTPAEAALWDVLKNGRLQGRKFRRQCSIGRYIVDFYCPAEKLIIELDGQIHNEPGQFSYDIERDSYLKGLGNIILRFENKMVFEHLEAVLESITTHITSQPPQMPH